MMGGKKDLSNEQIAQIKILLDEHTFSLRQITLRSKVSLKSVQNVKNRLRNVSTLLIVKVDAAEDELQHQQTTEF
jgi:hypothetical protein